MAINNINCGDDAMPAAGPTVLFVDNRAGDLGLTPRGWLTCVFNFTASVNPESRTMVWGSPMSVMITDSAVLIAGGTGRAAGRATPRGGGVNQRCPIISRCFRDRTAGAAGADDGVLRPVPRRQSRS